MGSKNFNNIVYLLKNYLSDGKIRKLEVDERDEIAVAVNKNQKVMVVYNCDLNSIYNGNFNEADDMNKKDAIKLLAKEFIRVQVGDKYTIHYIYFTGTNSYNYLYDAEIDVVDIDPIYNLSNFNEALEIGRVLTATQQLFYRIFLNKRI